MTASWHFKYFFKVQNSLKWNSAESDRICTKRTLIKKASRIPKRCCTRTFSIASNPEYGISNRSRVIMHRTYTNFMSNRSLTYLLGTRSRQMKKKKKKKRSKVQFQDMLYLWSVTWEQASWTERSKVWVIRKLFFFMFSTIRYLTSTKISKSTWSLSKLRSGESQNWGVSSKLTWIKWLSMPLSIIYIIVKEVGWINCSMWNLSNCNNKLGSWGVRDFDVSFFWLLCLNVFTSSTSTSTLRPWRHHKPINLTS